MHIMKLSVLMSSIGSLIIVPEFTAGFTLIAWYRMGCCMGEFRSFLQRTPVDVATDDSVVSYWYLVVYLQPHISSSLSMGPILTLTAVLSRCFLHEPPSTGTAYCTMLSFANTKKVEKRQQILSSLGISWRRVQSWGNRQRWKKGMDWEDDVGKGGILFIHR